MAQAKSKIIVAAICIGLAALAAYLIFYESKNSGAPYAVAKGGVLLKPGDYTPEMAQHCPVLFKASFCGWCSKMLEELEDAYFLVVETTEDSAAAAAAGVSGIPHTVHKDKQHVGYSADAVSTVKTNGTAEGLAKALALK